MTQSIIPFVLVLVAANCSHAGSRSSPTIALLQEFDSEGARCERCANQQEAERGARLIGDRAEIEIVRWLSDSFRPIRDAQDALFKSTQPEQRAAELNAAILTSGFCFEAEAGSSLCYKSERGSWLFSVELYTARMTLRDASGKRVWKREVPFLSAPVYPFVVNGWIIYIGHKNRSHSLVIIDAADGRVAGEYELSPHGLQGFSMLNPLSTFPVIIGEFIVLQGCEVQWLDSTRRSIEYVPGKIAILKTQGLIKIE